jgi:hypothetical protein
MDCQRESQVGLPINGKIWIYRDYCNERNA